MNMILTSDAISDANPVDPALSLDQVRRLAPAVFAGGAHARTSPKYTFIPTERILSGLMDAGFVPVEAKQVCSRRSSALFARHLVRLRRRDEAVRLRDSTPELLFLNSHDGTSAYQLRMGFFRFTCANGLIVSRGAFPGVCVSHRGNVVDAVVAGALSVAAQFDGLAQQVERMEARRLAPVEQRALADQALAVRYPDAVETRMDVEQLLRCRRSEDSADNLWCTLNRIQENLLAAGLSRRGRSGRLSRSRRITSIQEDLRINSQLWDLATAVLAA